MVPAVRRTVLAGALARVLVLVPVPVLGLALVRALVVVVVPVAPTVLVAVPATVRLVALVNKEGEMAFSLTDIENRIRAAESFISTAGANNYIANYGTCNNTNNVAGQPPSHYRCAGSCSWSCSGACTGSAAGK